MIHEYPNYAPPPTHLDHRPHSTTQPTGHENRTHARTFSSHLTLPRLTSRLTTQAGKNEHLTSPPHSARYHTVPHMCLSRQEFERGCMTKVLTRYGVGEKHHHARSLFACRRSGPRSGVEMDVCCGHRGQEPCWPVVEIVARGVWLMGGSAGGRRDGRTGKGKEKEKHFLRA